MKAIVIGAGPAGLTAAYQLSKEMPDVTVFEAAGHVGGLARSIRLWDQIVDLGPHRFFSKDPRVNELWLEVVARDYLMIKRQTRILYQGKLFQYPLEPLDVLSKLGPLEAVRCLGTYLRERMHPGDDRSFEEWICRRFGRRLYEIFFKTYSEKLWGIACDQLDADFAAQRIKKFSLSEALKSALIPARRKHHHTLAEEFAYPTEGTGMVYERMAKAVRQRGGEVRLNTAVKRVLTTWVPGKPDENASSTSSARKVTGVELSSGEVVSCEHLISTMPLTTLVQQIGEAPDEVLQASRQLKYRNTILVYLEVTGENPFPDQWIYVHSPELRLGRVTNFRNWNGDRKTPAPTAVLALEYWCDAQDEFWQLEDARIADLAREEIRRSTLIPKANHIGQSFVFRISKCYPIYHRGYRKQVDTIRSFVNGISGLQVAGRYGAFKYNNQDHSILMGCLAAENISRQHKHDLWSINADYETYQEA